MADSHVAHSFTVVIGDVSEPVRAALVDVVNDHPGLNLAGTAADGDAVAALCELHRPHLAIVDFMPSSEHRHAHDAIRAVSPGTVVAVFTVQADRRTTQRLLASGVDAVFQKGLADNLGDALHRLVLSAHSDFAT